MTSRPAFVRKFFALAALALALSACILIHDFGSVWNEAKPDMCLNKIAESLYYTEFRRDATGKDMGKLARGWTLNGHHYLLIKKSESDKGGRLYRFTVTHGIFERWRLVPTMRATFEKNYPNAPVSLKRDTVTIDAMNPETIALLSDIANRPEYWEVQDKTLYNTVLNPECRFEDRDLNAMKDNQGKK